MLAELFMLTAYAVGCGASNRYTAAMTTPVVDFTIAADRTVLPLGTIVHIDGVGIRMVHDVGSAIKGKRIDLFMSDCDAARQWGRRNRRVRVLHTPSRR